MTAKELDMKIDGSVIVCDSIDEKGIEILKKSWTHC